MAVLTEEDRFDVWADYMTRNTEEFSLLKADLRAAVDATDVWIQDNKVSFNNALPAVAKAALSNAQKSKLLTFVAAKRFGGGI
jgi:hypothetical protein